MIHAVADNVKVKLDHADPHKFSGGESTSKESGILVELPEFMSWLGYHSFAFEASWGDASTLTDVMEPYKKLLGKRVIWESFQDSGRRFKEGDDEYVLLKITDIIAYDDDPNNKIKTVTDVRRAGTFKA